MVTLRSFIACLCLGAWIAFVVPSAFGALKDYPVRFTTIKDGTNIEIVARNDGPSTISARLTISGDNFASDKTWPINIVMPRYSSRSIAKLWPVDSRRAWRFSYSSTHQFGDMQAVHDSKVLYRLPFEDGKTFRIDQAFGGVLTTHSSPEMQFAVDFNMPEGTPIVAARAGIVVDATLDNFVGGKEQALLDKANSVTILHDDGTVAEYGHLAQMPALVSRGQRVAAGDHIAYSGNTGYSSGPHLHFEVSRPALDEAGLMQQFALPVTFFTHNPPIAFRPQAMMMVSAIYETIKPINVAPPNSPSPDIVQPDIVNRSSSSIVTTRQPQILAPADRQDFLNYLEQALLGTDSPQQRIGIPIWAGIMSLLVLWLLLRVARAHRRNGPVQREK